MAPKKTDKKRKTSVKSVGRNTKFQVGGPGGPGRKPLPQVVKEVRKINRNDVEILFSECFNMKISELELIEKDPDSTAMQIAFAKCCIDAAKKGSLVHLEAILSRLFPPLSRAQEDNPLSPYQALRNAMEKMAEKKILDE